MKRSILVGVLIITLLVPVLPQLLYHNSGTSKSFGSVQSGRLENAYRLPYKGDHFKYFSRFSYYVLGRCYLHSDVMRIVKDSYNELHTMYPDYTFRIMECSKKKGGKVFPHRTHQNGASIDFMTPLKKGNRTVTRFDRIGVWRYIMKFDARGKKRWNKSIEIDFEKLAQHLLVLEKTARANGYTIKKVIIETNLKDELFDTSHGTALKKSGIYFVKSLPKQINELHDDHYHIDFVKL